MRILSVSSAVLSHIAWEFRALISFRKHDLESVSWSSRMQFNYALNQIEWEWVREGEIQLKFICSKSAGVDRHDSCCRRELCVSQKSTVSGICETTWDIKLLLLWLLRFASFSAYEVWLEFEEKCERREREREMRRKSEIHKISTK